MDKKVDKDWKKFSNPKEIKNNLIDASLYLSFYEMLNTAIVDKIADFFNMEFKDGKAITSARYKEVIINRKINGKINIFLSSCMWLIDNGVISQDEYDLIVRIKEHRNRIAHDLLKFLFDSEYIIDKDLFNQIKTLTLKIVKWWIIEFEITTNPEFDGQEIDTEKIVLGQEFILDYIFNIANTDIDELERTMNNMESQIKQ